MPQLITPPAALPVDVAEARAHVRFGRSTAEDGRLRRMIAGCTRWAEHETQCSLVAARWALTLDCFPRFIELEKGPVLRVVKVTYRDQAGEWQEVPEADYVVDLESVPARVAPAMGVGWPFALRYVGSVRVVYDAGHAAPLLANQEANEITVRGVWRSLSVGEAVRLSNSGGQLPSPLQPDTDYFIQAVVRDGVYRLATAPGEPVIDITDSGSGTHFLGVIPDNVVNWMLLRVGSLFDNREAEVALERGVLVSLPFVDRLLDGVKVIGY